MIHIHFLTFNPFQENTYILYDETKECVIIDPGCYEKEEKKEMKKFIEENKLKPVRLLNTHCHIDHILGNSFIADTYNLKLEMHEKDLPVLNSTVDYGQLFGLNVDPSPQPEKFLQEGDEIKFGNSKLKVIFVPGHAPGHIAFVCEDQKFVINGDVLFEGSIGRTDLPGGDHETLIESIMQKMLPLGDDYKVYTGHGSPTTIGFERNNNPFLN